MGSAFVPMIVDDSLNSRNIFFVNGPFSDGNGQHVHRISERFRGRQKKMDKGRKKLWETNSGSDFWVEMKKDGLKTGAKPGRS